MYSNQLDTKINDSVFMLERHKLKKYGNTKNIEPKEIEDIFIDANFKIDYIFKKD